ncbi:MAG: SDR family NAD(P)-dependent oxidoreductase [Gammaproteobacteria bacterium]|nr:SDR family NAD(P)-dependent oxidoreductase [Gammaproteobacteria bacterium]
MENQVILDESIEVQRPLHEAFAYVAEFSRIEEWDPAVARGIKQTPGAPGVGSEYQIDMRAGFSLQYRIIEFEKNARMLMTVDSRLFTALEEIRFEATSTGTRIRYIAKFDFPTPLAALNRAYPAAMERVGKRAMAGLQEALEDNFEAPRASRLLATADRLIVPGIWRFTKLGYKASRKHWDAVSRFQGDRHAVVTGATSGVGEAAARQLASLGARLTVIARSKKKAEKLVADLKKQTGNSHIGFEIADLSMMSEVHALCDRLLAAGEPIDMLINNAGALFNPRQQTPEGFEKSFALLLLSPYILTERLHPLLCKGESARVVNVSSGGMYSQKIRVNNLQSRWGTYSGSVAYARAKRGLMILTEEWAQRWEKDGIVVNAMHPGWADTPGVETALPGFYRITKPFLRTPDEGADTAVWLAASTEAAKITGKFWLDREQHPSHLSQRTRETAAERRQLLETLQELRESTVPKKPRRRRKAGPAK